MLGLWRVLSSSELIEQGDNVYKPYLVNLETLGEHHIHILI